MADSHRGEVVGSEEISKFVSASSDSRHQRLHVCSIARNGLNQRRKNTKGQTHRLPSDFKPYLLNWRHGSNTQKYAWTGLFMWILS